MKYSCHSSRRKKRPNDPDYQAQLGYRLRTARKSMGWSIPDAAKYFQVTERTWHNWEIGAHRIPFAVYKLCRVLAHMELPGDAWAGWSIQGANLVTPEGRIIQPKDGAWWSLLVRNANAFMAAFNEARRLRLLMGNAASAPAGPCAAGAGFSGADAAGLVPSKTSLKTGDTLPPNRHQIDVTMASWPTLYDSQTPLTPPHGQKLTTLESALTPSFASPWMHTCAYRLRLPRPLPGPHLATAKPHLKQMSASLSQNPESSPEPKNRPSTNGKKPSSNALPGNASAMPAAAGAAKLASATGGKP
nr:VC1465 family Xer recombination activation factor [uncultured Rhodoferax sp.]